MDLRSNHYLHSSQSHPLTRHWQCQGNLNFSTKDFVLPLFVLNDDCASQPCESFPGVTRMGSQVLIDYLRPLVTELKLASILLFPSLSGSKKLDDAFDEHKNPLLRVIPLLKSTYPELLVIADVCLCTFTENGHCCLFDENGRMDNGPSVQVLADLSLKYAKVGVDVVAPSDMMDSRVAAIRTLLNTSGYSQVTLLSYSAKFESCFYGPFRDAAGSAPQFGDRKCYQLPTGSRGLAMRAVERDVREGADMVMVKPAMAYLDLVRSIADQFPWMPVAVYQVSGEYTMLTEAANRGVFDLKRVLIETLSSFKRAGASIIISYFTPQVLSWIKSGDI